MSEIIKKWTFNINFDEEKILRTNQEEGKEKIMKILYSEEVIYKKNLTKQRRNNKTYH